MSGGLAVWHPWLCRGPFGVSGHAGYESPEVYSAPLPEGYDCGLPPSQCQGGRVKPPATMLGSTG